MNADEASTQLINVDDFAGLKVEYRGDERTVPILPEVWGSIQDDHAYLSIRALESAGRALDGDWARRFSEMIEYARAHGWVSADGLHVRAHVVRST